MKRIRFNTTKKKLKRPEKTYIHTYQSDVIEPPAGVQLAVFQARLIIILQESLSPRHSSEDPCPQPHSIADNPILRNKQVGL